MNLIQTTKFKFSFRGLVPILLALNKMVNLSSYLSHAKQTVKVKL